MTDKPGTMERFGIEHIPEDQRHGSTGRVFTLWFAANLTIADYVIGVLCVLAFHLTLLQSIPILAAGNVLGGLALGLSAAMGPRLGFPQMFSSRAVFGRRGNYALGMANWISTAGWFTVNTILGAEAVEAIAPGFSLIATSVLLVALQVIIAIFGHDLIHSFEKLMSVVLGILFLGIFVISIPRLGEALAFIPAGASDVPSIGSIGVVLAVSFSYIMSWAPYASDYSRYLPATSSVRKVAALALAGGALASFAIEVIGGIVGSLTQSFDYFGALKAFAGTFGTLAVFAIILGAMAANALNIYTNSLSALVLDLRVKRWVTVIAGGLVGLGLAILGGANFESFFENFLLILDYWITPWLSIILVDFFVLRRTTVESCLHARNWEVGVLSIYGLSILCSVPFMVPPTTIGWPVGSLAGWFGGADFSYYVSFFVAGLLYFLYRERTAGWWFNGSQTVSESAKEG
ncbi:MAG: cytosine permease [Conexivisphaerales archaeon]|jgi:NCS1 family nucleobase:cation symporter-1